MEQYRLKELFMNSLMSLSVNEPVFQEVIERKNKDDYNCTHYGSKQVVRFRKYKMKLGLKELKGQRYRCKNCSKTFTDITYKKLSLLRL